MYYLHSTERIIQHVVEEMCIVKISCMQIRPHEAIIRQFIKVLQLWIVDGHNAKSQTCRLRQSKAVRDVACMRPCLRSSSDIFNSSRNSRAAAGRLSPCVTTSCNDSMTASVTITICSNQTGHIRSNVCMQGLTLWFDTFL
jgi:hypothetical protein